MSYLYDNTQLYINQLNTKSKILELVHARYKELLFGVVIR